MSPDKVSYWSHSQVFLHFLLFWFLLLKTNQLFHVIQHLQCLSLTHGFNHFFLILIFFIFYLACFVNSLNMQKLIMTGCFNPWKIAPSLPGPHHGSDLFLNSMQLHNIYANNCAINCVLSVCISAENADINAKWKYWLNKKSKGLI